MALAARSAVIAEIHFSSFFVLARFTVSADDQVSLRSRRLKPAAQPHDLREAASLPLDEQPLDLGVAQVAEGHQAAPEDAPRLFQRGGWGATQFSTVSWASSRRVATRSSCTASSENFRWHRRSCSRYDSHRLANAAVRIGPTATGADLPENVSRSAAGLVRWGGQGRGGEGIELARRQHRPERGARPWGRGDDRLWQLADFHGFPRR